MDLSDSCTVCKAPKEDLSDSCTVSKVYKDQLEVPKVDLSDSCTVSKVCKGQLEHLSVSTRSLRRLLHKFLYRYIYDRELGAQPPPPWYGTPSGGPGGPLQCPGGAAMPCGALQCPGGTLQCPWWTGGAAITAHQWPGGKPGCPLAPACGP